MLCSELNHTRGNNIRGCLMCSMPVCEACIIKESFGKRDEKTFQHRTRTLCSDCYDSETPHIEQALKPGMEGKDVIHRLRKTWSTCVCTPKEGYLCLRCKIEQRSKMAVKLARCYGQGCTRTQLGGFPGRICLWCDLRLPGERSRAEARRDYDARHLLARSHSSFERPVDEEFVSSAQVKKNLIYMAERDERLRRFEALPRPKSTFYPPPPVIRQRTDNAAESNGRQHYVATSSNLVVPLLSYDYSLFSTGTAAGGSQEGSDSKT